MNVAEVEFRRFGLGRVFFIRIAQLTNVRMPKQGVIIKRHFGIKADHVAFFSQYQGIYFDQRGVGFDEGTIKRTQQSAKLSRLLVTQSECKSELAALKGRQTDYRINWFGQYLVWRFGVYLFDFHSAFGATNNCNAFGFAVDDNTKIKFANDVTRMLDIDPPDD